MALPAAARAAAAAPLLVALLLLGAAPRGAEAAVPRIIHVSEPGGGVARVRSMRLRANQARGLLARAHVRAHAPHAPAASVPCPRRPLARSASTRGEPRAVAPASARTPCCAVAV